MKLQQNIINNNDRPGFIFGFILICIYALLSVLIAPLLVKITDVYPDLRTWQLFIGFTLSFGLLVPIAFKLFKIKNIDKDPIPFYYYLILIPGILAMAVVVESIVILIPMNDKWAEIFANAIKFNFPTFLSVAIAAPIFEELIFRGVILKGFLKKYSPQTAIILSAILFGIAHMNPWQFIAAFAVGYVIGLLYWKTKSILPGIFIHFVNNSFSFWLAYQARDINTNFVELVGSNLNYAILLITSISVCFFIALYFYKQFANKKVLQKE